MAEHAHFGELDATMFAESDPDLGPHRAIGVFGRTESGPSSSLFMNPAHSEDRSVGVMGLPTSQFSRFSMMDGGMDAAQETSVFHAMSKAPALEVITSSSSATAFSSSSVVSFPEKPCFLVRTHFKTKFESRDAPSIVQFLEATLQHFPDFDFSFFPPPDGETMWKGKYIRSSKSCEVYVRVYSDGDSEEFIVEANRVKGDSKPFISFYKEFKSIITKTPSKTKRGGDGMFLAPLPSQQPVSDEQFLTGIRPIFTMVQDVCMEPRCEGVKMLCELASHDSPLLRLQPCLTQVVGALEHLVADEMEDVKQHAIMAVSNFINLADIPAYKSEVLGCAPLLERILKFAAETPLPAGAPTYDSIQARRECAHILFMLSEFDASATLRALEQSAGASSVRKWLDSIAYTQDLRLKNYMSSARDNFLTVVAK